MASKNRIVELLKRLKSALLSINKQKIDITTDRITSEVYDYQGRLKNYLLKMFYSTIDELKSIAKSDDLKEFLQDARRLSVKKIDELIDKASSGSENDDVIKSDINFDLFPVEIKREVELDCKEIENCYRAGCYRSAIILCGRVLEVCLHRKYFEVTKNDLLEKSPGIGLGKIIAKLSENDVKLGPGISQQIHLINNVRINSVHTKKDTFVPNKNQTMAIILFTFDLVNKLIK